MNPEIKAEWVKRLRDGRKQGMGVLCEIASEQGVITRETQSGSDRPGEFDVSYGDSQVMPPLAVRRWAGVNNWILNISDNGIRGLDELNDRGYSFEYIANAIEANF